jgi:hypothetical protein
MKIANDDAYIRVIKDSPSLNDESKDRYVRSLFNLVRASKRGAGGGAGIAFVLQNGKNAMRDLLAHFALTKNGAVPSDSTVSSHCVAALALIKRLPEDAALALGGRDFLHSQWESCNAESSKNIRDKYDNWRASEQQKQNFVSWEHLIAKREELGEDKRTFASPPHVLLSFLTMLPPMRTSDYSSLRLFDEVELPRSNAKDHAAMKNEWNYVQLKKTCGRLVVNEYKTANHYKRIQAARGGVPRDGVHISHNIVAGPMYIPRGTYDDAAACRSGDLPPALFKVLKAMVKKDATEEDPTKTITHGRSVRRRWVFLNANNEPYTGRTFGMMVNRTMKQLFDGKAVTVNLVRHAASNWLDEHYRHNKPVLLFFRHWMMHSVNMQREYVLANNLDDANEMPDVPSSSRSTQENDE